MSRVWNCVRCGSRPRWNQTFLCLPCYDDPQRHAEVNDATEKVGSGPAARRYLVDTHHWAGNWSTRG